MSRTVITAVVVMLSTSIIAAPVPKLRPTFGESNTNELVKQHKDKLKVDASTEYSGYPATRLIDGEPTTVWYSAGGDSPMAGKTPHVGVTFPEDVRVKRVTVLGTRDPNYKDGYFILEGTVELLDKDGKLIAAHEVKSAGDQHDFDLKLDQFTTVRGVRFKATKDQNKYSCVALSEIQME